MNADRIRELRRADPFKPFYLVMDDGRKLPVEHPVYLGVSPTGKSLAYAAPQGGFDFLAVGTVRDIEVDERMETKWMQKLRVRVKNG
jgi:hypothetical protein